MNADVLDLHIRQLVPAVAGANASPSGWAT